MSTQEKRLALEVEQFHQLLAAGVQYGASDIHFRPGTPPLYRVKKRLMPLEFQRIMPDDTLSIAGAVLGIEASSDELQTLQERDTSYSLAGVARFRVNIYRQRGSLALVLRIIPRDIPTIESLNLPPVIETIADFERGLVLVCGATGSGKSSTLAAVINHINQTKQVHVVTIEDPIEFLHRNSQASISQREIGPDTLNYVVGLRAALRQDPDVILVGEMRDAESFDIALKAAETGHAVLSTAHTTDAAKTIGRMIGVFPPEEQETVRHRLADNLHAIISQRLVPAVEGGLHVVAEIVLATPSVREVLHDPSRIAAITDLAAQGRSTDGSQTFDQHLAELYHAGTISLQTAIQAATSPNDFQRSLMME